MLKDLINVSDLRELMKSDSNLDISAKTIEGVEGYVLNIKTADNTLVLSTYLSDKPRFFKRADALIKEAKKLNINSVIFEI
jgi:hypothetical protein